jgi:hypothetical protein
MFTARPYTTRHIPDAANVLAPTEPKTALTLQFAVLSTVAKLITPTLILSRATDQGRAVQISLLLAFHLSIFKEVPLFLNLLKNKQNKTNPFL